MKTLEIKQKLINHITLNGEKKTGEKIVLNCFKELHKKSKRKTDDIMKLAIINATPIFKLHTIKNKKSKKRKVKEIPAFITNNIYRVSLAIKFIINSIKKKKEHFYSKLEKEIILNSQQKGEAVQLKNNLQQKVLVQKKYLKFYRWK
jgi:ribosomal protein S7